VKELFEIIKNRIASAQKVLFLFDDDVDGLASYLCLKPLAQRSKGVIIKSTPVLKDEYARVVELYKPSLVVILDKPMVSPDFFSLVHLPIIWIDHHSVQQVPENVLYFNPRIADDSDNRCTSYWAYQISHEREWIAAAGNISDWQITDVVSTFAQKHPDMLDPKITDPAEALFASPFGKIIKMLTFNLKGSSTHVKKSILAIENLTDYTQLLRPTTEDAEILVKRFADLSEEYDRIIESVQVGESPIIFFEYEPTRVSVTTELSNELLYRHPKKVIFIARRKENEYKCSLRASHIELPPIIEKALVGLIGYGGGHAHACGACVSATDFETFKERLEEMLRDY